MTRRTRTRRNRVARGMVLPAVVAVIAGASFGALVGKAEERSARGQLEQRADEVSAALSAIDDDVVQAVDTAQGMIAATSAEQAVRADALQSLPSLPATINAVALADRAGQVLATNGTPVLLDGLDGDWTGLAAVDAGPSLVAGGREGDWSRLGYVAPTGRDDVVLYAEVALAPGALQNAPDDVSFVLRAQIGGSDVELIASGTDATGHVETRAVAVGTTAATLVVQEKHAVGTGLAWLAAFCAAACTALLAITARSMWQWRRELRVVDDERRLLDQALSQQRQVEAALGASKAQLQTVLDSSPDALAIVEGDHAGCELLNRPDLLGHQPDALRTGGFGTFVHDDDAAALQRWWAARKSRPPADSSDIVFRAVDAGGQVRHLRLRIVPLRRGGHDSHRRSLATFTDITDERAREQRQRELQAELQKARHLEALGRLAGGVAHDFNNVLAAVRVHAELLGQRVDADDVGHVEVIERATERAAALVQQLVAFARRDVGEPQPVDLREAVAGIQSLVVSSAGRAVTVEFDLHPDRCVTRIDPSQLDQLILNLVCNSRDAMPLGGTLRIATTVGLRPVDLDSAMYALLIVADTGTGIAEPVVEHVFEPFFTTKGEQGSGLGLATVYGIVTALGGHVDIQSRPGHGTTVTISLPLDSSATPPAPRPAVATPEPAVALPEPAVARPEPAVARPEPAVARDRPLVALIDDEQDVLTPTALLLRGAGFDVIEATRGQDGLAAIARRPPDVVLADIVMPGGMHGLDVAHIIEREFPGVPVVLMTGNAFGRLGHNLTQSHHRLIAKPFAANQLFQTLRDAIEESRA